MNVPSSVLRQRLRLRAVIRSTDSPESTWSRLSKSFVVSTSATSSQRVYSGERDDSTVIKTSRLELKPPRTDDAAALFRNYATDAEVTKYLVWAPHKSVEETRRFIASRSAKWETGEAFAWTIALDVRPEPIGMIELRPDDGTIGYVLGRRWWSRGIITEALQAVVNYARETLGLSVLRAWCDAENIGSARVLEKAGFTRERTGPAPMAHSGFGDKIRPALFYVCLNSH